MKKIFFCISMFCITLKVFGDDVSATVTNAEIGMSNGAISLTISAGYTPFVFLWTGPDGFTSTEQNIDALAAGEYCVTINDLFCGVAQLCVTVEEGMQNAISEINFSDLQIAPNPFSTGFNVIFDNAASGNYNFALYDLTGNKMISTQVSVAAGNTNIPFELPAILAPGNYMFTISDEGEHAISKQVVFIK